MKVHHIGYLVSDIERAVKKMELLGFTSDAPTIEDEARNIGIRFMTNGNTVIELVCPRGEKSAVGSLAGKAMNGPYHLCYETGDIDEAIRQFAAAGFVLTQKPAPAPAIGGRRVAFMFQKQAGLIEFVEIKP